MSLDRRTSCRLFADVVDIVKIKVSKSKVGNIGAVHSAQKTINATGQLAKVQISLFD